jgi:hypothetical protein
VVEHEDIRTAPIYAGGSEVLVGWSSWDAHELLIFDVADRTVRPMENRSERAMLFRPPLAGPMAPERRVAGGWAAELLVFDFFGALLFQRKLPLALSDVLADVAGNIVVSTSVDQKYWLNYRDPYKLHDACVLTSFDPVGNLRSKWIAPGPITSSLAVGRQGELYCMSEGRLFAID